MQNNEFENYEEEIYYYLTNPGKISRVSFMEDTYNKNVDLIFTALFDEKYPTTSQETVAYLCGKACEMNILKVLRPEFKRIWLSQRQVTEGIVFNLPLHIEDKVLEVMDGCESAVAKYISEKDPDVKNVLLDIQFIAEEIVKKHRLFDVKLEGYKNSEIAFPSELYAYANNIGLKALVDNEGYKVLGATDNFNSAISCVLESPKGEKMAVLEQVTISPRTAKFANYLIEDLVRYANKEKLTPYCLGVMLEPEDEEDRKNSIVVKGKKVSLKMTSFIPAK